VRRSPSRTWSRHPGPSVESRILACLGTPGPDGPVPWTIRELAEGTGAHPTTIGDTLPRIAGVERAGWAVFPGASGRTARAQLWRLKL
jgi:hypothetical protein